MNSYLCFDLGGTYTKYALINTKGQIVLSDKYHTGEITDPELLLKQFVLRFFALKKQYHIIGAGFSCHGIIDPKRGYIAFGSPYVKALENYPLVERFKQETGMTCVVIENDVNAAAIGEAAYWQESHYQNYLFLTLGTSIGGAIILNGQLYRGVNNAAGEFGYMVTHAQANKLGSVNKESKGKRMLPGAWESYASANKLLDMYCAATQSDKVSIVDFKAQLLNSNPVAVQIFEEYLYELIMGLVSLTHVLAPELIIIGGAISEESFFIDAVKQYFQQNVLPFYRETKIMPAHLGNQAGVQGIACLLSKIKVC
ncbi:ROK family protein [Cysteiniphilum halobium]|uniref:ROK family protein n=1 Tax=Cysteiniphilum halobium TaxID=2219059 RepID=UPI000E65E316|nr:ROK family protein [Cysteiniphilum halobium]